MHEYLLDILRCNSSSNITGVWAAESYIPTEYMAVQNSNVDMLEYIDDSNSRQRFRRSETCINERDFCQALLDRSSEPFHRSAAIAGLGRACHFSIFDITDA
jgi:hypothetical protein